MDFENSIWNEKMKKFFQKTEEMVDEVVKIYKDIDDILLSAEAKQLVYRTVKRDLINSFVKEGLKEGGFLPFTKEEIDEMVIDEIMRKAKEGSRI